MATRTSAMRSQENYLGSRRGRPIAMNIGIEDFLDTKFAPATPIIENSPFDQLNEDRRDTLKDYYQNKILYLLTNYREEIHMLEIDLIYVKVELV